MRRSAAILALLVGCGGREMVNEPEELGSSTSGEPIAGTGSDGPGATSTAAPESLDDGPSSSSSDDNTGSSTSHGSSSDGSTGAPPVCLVEGSGFPCLDVLEHASMCDAGHPDLRPQCFLALALLFGGDADTQSTAIEAAACDGPCAAMDACAAEIGEPVCARWSDETAIECGAPIFDQVGPNASAYVCEQLG